MRHSPTASEEVVDIVGRVLRDRHDVPRLAPTHLCPGTLVAGWDEVLSRLIEYGLAWKLQTPPELPC